MTESRKKLYLCLWLALGTAALYWPVIRHDFINYDDHQYITYNRVIQSGLTFHAIDWAFRSGYASNWHPITWISHMLDCQIYGLNPAGHHLTNLIFHCLNSVLLFVLLNQMTGALWRSGFVAAMLAWHPLHVESVAWAAERKDLLCGFFWILTMLVYLHYVRETDGGRRSKTWMWYGTALLLFALALMSKPMAVTLPFVLLIMDVWPLGRTKIGDSCAGAAKAVISKPAFRFLLLEKVPFVVLSMASSVITVLVQRNAASSLQEEPLPLRIENAAVAYLRYIAKTFWPARLAVMYPFPKQVSLGLVIVAALTLVFVSGLFLGAIKRRPYLAAGWFWFLGTLVPVIGLVQVGGQAIADRYTYLPGIGLSVIIAWGAADLLTRFSGGAKICLALGACALAACVVATRHQLSYWQNSVTLFRHTIAVTEGNCAAYGALGTGLDEQSQTAEALRMCEESVRLEPRYAQGQYNLGSLLLRVGRTDEAIEHFELALKQEPHFAEAENNLGKALLAQGKAAEAESHLKAALELAPGDAVAHFNLGTVLLRESKIPAAAAEFSRALKLEPDYAEAHGNLAIALAESGRLHEALEEFSEQVRLAPADSMARINFGNALMAQNKTDQASAQFTEALRLQPEDPVAHCCLATALAKEGKAQDAIAQYREALRLRPDLKEAQSGLEQLGVAGH
jgi:tetratricopeptide (TPR) repeat protein